MKLESFIRDKRKELDVEQPDEKYLWEKIWHGLEKIKRPRQRILFRSAAAIAAIMILSVMAAYFIGRNQQPKLIFVNIDPGLAKQESLLLGQISNYSKQMHKAGFNPAMLNTTQTDLNYVDDLIALYSEDLKRNGPNPKLINSLMDLYQKKILLLNRILNEIEKNESHEKRKINM
jgi:hypothetical protein